MHACRYPLGVGTCGSHPTIVVPRLLDVSPTKLAAWLPRGAKPDMTPLIGRATQLGVVGSSTKPLSVTELVRTTVPDCPAIVTLLAAEPMPCNAAVTPIRPGLVK